MIFLQVGCVRPQWFAAGNQVPCSTCAVPEMKWVLHSRLPSFGSHPWRFTAAIQRCFLSGSRGKR